MFKQGQLNSKLIIVLFLLLASFVVYILSVDDLKQAANKSDEANSVLMTTTPSPDLSPASSTEEANTSQNGTESQIGYIKSIYHQDNKTYLTIDYVQWLDELSGKCNNADLASNLPQCNPNGYLIVNNNPQIRTFEISDKVMIDFSAFKEIGLMWKDDQPLAAPYLNLNDFQEIFLETDDAIEWLKDALYWLELDGKLVTKITYQYQP